MAVSARRVIAALVRSQFQVWVNTALRNAGVGASTFAAVVVAAIVGSVGFSVFVTCFAAAFGSAELVLAGDGSVPGLLLTGCGVGGAWFSVISGDSSALEWSALRRFPLKGWWLFVGEAVASVTAPVMLFTVVGELGVLFGLGLRVPSLWPLASVAVVVTFLVQVALRLFFGATAQAALRLSRFAVLAVLTVLMVAFFRWFDGLNLGAVTPAAFDANLENDVADAVDVSRLVFGALPASRFFEAPTRTGLAAWWAALGPLLVALAVVVLAVRLSRREAAAHETATDGRPETLWSFRSPVWGIAKLQLLTLWRSDVGRVALFSPLFALFPMSMAARFLVRLAGAGQVPSFVHASLWVVGSLSSTSVVMNQFGLDRGAIKALMLLPLRPVDLVRGKALGFLLFEFAQVLAVVPLARWVLHADLASILAGLLTATTLFLVQLTFGQWASVTWPRPISSKGLRTPPGSLLSIMLSLLVSGLAIGPLMAIWVVVAQVWPVAVLPALLALAVLSAAVQWRLSFECARWLTMRRERLVEALS